MKSYKINVIKITHTVTGNANNFGKSFRVYAQQFSPLETIPTNNNSLYDQNINILIDAFDQNTKNCFELESEFLQNSIGNQPDNVIDVVDISDIFMIKYAITSNN